MKRMLLGMALAFCGAAMAEPTLIAHWPFGESGLSDAVGNHTLVLGGPSSRIALEDGVAKFNGVASDATKSFLKTESKFDFSGCSAVTVSMWVKLDRTSSGRDNWSLCELSQNYNSYNGAFQLCYTSYDDGIVDSFTIGRHTANWDVGYASASPYATESQWYHVVAVLKDGEYSTVYVNGEIGSPSSKYKNKLTGFLNDYLYFGSRSETTRFVGEMDDIKIYSGALTAQEIKAEYDAVRAAGEKGEAIAKETPQEDPTDVSEVEEYEWTRLDAGESAVGKAGYPLVVFRLTAKPYNNPDFFRQTCEVHRKYPGAFDDFWFGGGNPLCRTNLCDGILRTFAKERPLMEECGMRLSFQQGLTTGHNYTFVGTPGAQAAAGVYLQEDVYPFSDDAWQVTLDGGKLVWQNLCPRSPEVLEYEKAFVKTAIAALRPYTYWLDDDLRLGVGKSSCYCDRCIRAFNAFAGTEFNRAQLVDAINGSGALREKWIRFSEDSLAKYGRAVREAANEVMPECRLGLQTVRSTNLLNGRDYAPILRELSDNGRVPAGIRPGDGYYVEDNPDGMLEKAMFVVREAERCRQMGNLCGTVCYEEETYPRLASHKTPQAIVNEATLAIASGCDSVSLYWADGEPNESIEDYERFVKAVAGARGYWERLSASTKRTSLGGLAQYWGSERFGFAGFNLDDYNTMRNFLWWGIPVTVDESTASNKLYLVTNASRATMAAGETVPNQVSVSLAKLPTVDARKVALDALDAASEGRFPVRIDVMHPLRVLPRIDRQGKTDSVTLFNLSVGAAEDLKVRVRQPLSRNAQWQTPRGVAVSLKVEDGASSDEVVVTIPRLAARSIGTVFFDGVSVQEVVLEEISSRPEETGEGLPSDYARLDWIESTVAEQQFVDVPYVTYDAAKKVVVTMDCMFTGQASTYQVPCAFSTGGLGCLWLSGNSTNFGNDALGVNATSLAPNDRKTVVWEVCGANPAGRKEILTVNGTEVKATGTCPNANDYAVGKALSIFAGRDPRPAYSSAPDGYSNLRLYSFKVEQGGQLVADLVPALDADGEAGLYDVVARRFLVSKSANQFRHGDAPPVPAPAIAAVSARQRYPWNGKVDIAYTVTGSIANAAKKSGGAAVLRITAKDRGANKTYVVTGEKASMLTAGTHELVWDFGLQGEAVTSGDVVFEVACELGTSGTGEVICSGSSEGVRLDMTAGIRTAAATEIIRYGSTWVTAISGAKAVVAVNGEPLEIAAGTGSVTWTPVKEGVYTLTHTVMVGMTQVGDTLSATFTVGGDESEYVTDGVISVRREVFAAATKGTKYENAKGDDIVPSNGLSVVACVALGIDLSEEMPRKFVVTAIYRDESGEWVVETSCDDTVIDGFEIVKSRSSSLDPWVVSADGNFMKAILKAK